MKDLRIKKTVYEIGTLPAIIADKKVFAEMTRAERTVFYKNVNEALQEKEYQKSQDLYKAMCLYPEKRLNKAYLEKKFKDEKKWQLYVSVLAYALYEHISIHLDKWQDEYKHYTAERNRAKKRMESLQADIKKYSSENMEAA